MNRSSDGGRAATLPARTRAVLGRLRHDERGQGLAELAIALPILLLLAFGILEVGRLLEQQHTISGLTREGANLASRGGTLEQALTTTRTNQVATGLGPDGGVIVSRVVVENGLPRVAEQVASDGFALSSRVALPDSIASPYLTSGLREGQRYYVVEMFVPYQSFTPFGSLLENVVPEVLYDRSLF